MKTIEELKEHFPNIEFSDKYLEILNYIRNDENCKVSIQGNAGSGKSTILKIINYSFMTSFFSCGIQIHSNNT